SGLNGWVTTALAVDPTNADVVYVAQLVAPQPVGVDVVRLFKSTNGGEQWREIPIPVPPVPNRTQITSLAIDPSSPSIIYAGYGTCPAAQCSGGGVVKSIDSGETWLAAQDGLSDAGWVNALAIDPSAPTRIYAATTRGGVFRSAD